MMFAGGIDRKDDGTYRSCLLQWSQDLRPVIKEVSAVLRERLNSSGFGEPLPRNGDREVRARDVGSDSGFSLQNGFVPLDELDEGGGAGGEGEGESSADAGGGGGGEESGEEGGREGEGGVGEGVVFVWGQGCAVGELDGVEGVAVEEEGEALGGDFCAGLVEDVGGGLLGCGGGVLGTVWEAVFDAGVRVGEDGDGDRVAPGAGFAVEVVEAVVPEDVGDVVLRCGAGEVV